MRTPPILRRLRPTLVLMLGALALFAAPAVARAGELTPGAVFTQTNTVPNFVAVFQRAHDGTLTAAGQVATGGAGRPAGNPPAGLPTLDSGRDVELSSDGDGKHCLFVTNAGSNTVSSFDVGPNGLTLADQQPTNGSRPISLTSTQRGPMSRVLYVLNSDVGAASIQGYYVSGRCALTPIPGSFQQTSSPTSLPANIAFNQRGTALAVSERFANGFGDLDVFPVGTTGVAGAPVVSPSVGMTPYGLEWDSRGHLTVSNEHISDLGATSTVSSYRLTKDFTLEPVNTAPSPGAACWNVITNNGKFLYVSGPTAQLVGGHSVTVFSVANDGSLTPTGDGQNTPHNAIDEALSHDSKFLYVLSDQLIPPAPVSTISEYAIDENTGALTPIGSLDLPSNSTAGLAAW